MSEQITLTIDKGSLEDHVARICKGNLKLPRKICTQCPILGPVIGIMEERGWEYNTEAMQEPIKKYYANLPGYKPNEA